MRITKKPRTSNGSETYREPAFAACAGQARRGAALGAVSRAALLTPRVPISARRGAFSLGLRADRRPGTKRSRVWPLAVAGLLPWLFAPMPGAWAEINQEALVVEKVEHGEVNWSEKFVVATGSGAPNLKLPSVAAVRLNAERAAKVDAYRNVLETLKGVQITTGQAGSARLESAQVRAEVQGVLKECRTIDTRYYSDGGVDIVIKCPLDGGLSTVLAPAGARKAVPAEGQKTYTGLVVDASAVKARPMIAPRVVNQSGAEIYVQEMAAPSVVRSSGAVAYARTLEAALKDVRAGSNPLVLKVSSLGSSGHDLVIPDEEAKKLEGQSLAFLTEAKVVLVISGRAP